MDYLESNCLSFDAQKDDINDVHQNEIDHHDKEQTHTRPLELSCNFKATKGRILKTVDSVYQNVTTLEECRLKCVGANFRYCCLKSSSKI